MRPFSTFGLPTVNVAATTTTGNVAINKPEGASCQVEIYNSGSVPVFVKKGDSTVAATTAGRPVAPGATILDSIGAGVTHFAAITASGTATVYFTTGEGL